MAAQSATVSATPGPSTSTGSSGLAAMALVDNGQVEGGEPIGVVPGPGAPKSPKGRGRAPEAPSQNTEDLTAGPDWGSLEKIFELNDGAPEVETEGEDFSGSEEEPQTPEEQEGEEKFGNRAEKRIRGLLGKNKELSQNLNQTAQRLNQYEQWAQQSNQYNQQMQQIFQQQQMQIARLEAYAQAQAQYRTQASRQEPEDPVDQFKRGVIGDVSQQLHKQLSPEVQKAVSRVEQLEQRLMSERQAQETQQRKAYYNQQTDAAAAQHLLPLLHPDDAQQLGPALGDFVMLRAILGAQNGQNYDFNTAAQDTKDFILKVAKSFVRSRTQKVGSKVAASQSTPTPAPKGRNGAKGTGTPGDAATKTVNSFRQFMQDDMRGRR